MESNWHSTEELAAEVAILLGRRLAPKDILRLLYVVFMTVEETADLLRVKPSTVSTWISNGTIPVRYAGGRPLFLLAELMEWTLPDSDRHSRHRLSVAASCKIATQKLAATRERVVTDGGLQETSDLVLPLSD